MRWSRRELLERGGLLAGALSLGVGLEAALGGPKAAAALSAGRRRTYTALVEAAVSHPSLRLDPACAAAATEDFADAYAAWAEHRRRWADRVLDALERSSARPFSALDGRGRCAHLSSCARLTSHEPTGAESERLDLVRQAMTLVAVGIGPAEGDHRLVTV